VGDDIERLGMEEGLEGVVDHPRAHAQKAGIVEILLPIELESAQIVGVTDFRPAGEEDLPVAGSCRMAVVLLKVCHQSALEALVIEYGVVDVEEKDPFIVQ
jgi:hypothetical protein